MVTVQAEKLGQSGLEMSSECNRKEAPADSWGGSGVCAEVDDSDSKSNREN